LSTPRVLDQSHGLIGSADVGDDDVHAVLGEPPCKRLPDAVGGAGDDATLVAVPLAHSLPQFACEVVLSDASRAHTPRSYPLGEQANGLRSLEAVLVPLSRNRHGPAADNHSDVGL